jgi:vacuolar-type H+-ATPase subunit F/Vma7
VTLAIGAKYPWGSLRKLTVFQKDSPQAILFVTDSRWTKYYPNNQYEFENVGTKVFLLTQDSALVYSGDVISAEHCVSELKQKLRKLRNKNFTTSLYMAQHTFQRIHNYHKKSRKTKVFPLFFLIGTCDKSSKANLMYFCSPKFSPIFIEGMHGIGVREANKDLEAAVSQRIDAAVEKEFASRSRYPILERLPGLQVQTQAEHAGMLIAAAMQEVILK